MTDKKKKKKKTTTTTSKKTNQGHVCEASKMESLSSELMMDILSRVPTVELGKLRCVCKRWRDMVKVKDPLFRTLHSSHSMSRPSKENNLLLLKGLDDGLCFLDLAASRSGEVVSFKKIKTPYDDVPSLRRYDIIGSCNGLLCLARGDDREILVMNPFTNQHMRLDANFSGKFSAWGFGFDSVKKRYRVVVIVWNKFYAERELKICDLDGEGSSNWRDLGRENMFNHEVSYIERPCFLNGRLHWPCYNNDGVCFIISFDLAYEEFRLIPTPPDFPLITSFDLFVLRDFLCIIGSQPSSPSLTPSLEIWFMKEYGVMESWVKEVDTVALIPKSVFSHFDKYQKWWGCRPDFKGLGFIRDGKVLLTCRGYLKDAILCCTDPTCDRFQFLEYEGAIFCQRSIIHTASLYWIQ